MQPDILLVAESLDVVDTDAHDDTEGDPDVVTLPVVEPELERVPDVVTDELDDGVDDPDVESDSEADDVAQLLLV